MFLIFCLICWTRLLYLGFRVAIECVNSWGNVLCESFLLGFVGNLIAINSHVIGFDVDSEALEIASSNAEDLEVLPSFIFLVLSSCNVNHFYIGSCFMMFSGGNSDNSGECALTLILLRPK